MTGTQRILGEIQAERYKQDDRWGGPDHDDMHEDYEWLHLIFTRAKEIDRTGGPEAVRVRYRRKLIEIAAIAVAATEALDRKAKS